MAMKTRSPRKKIYLQTSTLMYKNLLLFKNAWFWTIMRAFVFPVAVAIIFSFLIHLGETSSGVHTNNYGIAPKSTPLRDLKTAIDNSPSNKLVFVRNGISNDKINPIVQRISQQPGMDSVQILNVNDVDDLFDLCKQTLQGVSDCFAAVVFTSFNETNVEYSIALDSHLIGANGYGNFRSDNSLLSTRVLPLQWAIDTSIGHISITPKPSLQRFTGSFGPNSYYQRQTPTAPSNGPYWLSLVAQFVAPIFIMILIGVFYHLATLVATEREGSTSELMAAQGITLSSRILSTYLSFYLIYFPGFLACSIIMTQVLFKRTSDILFLFITLLAGASTVTSAHFVASFFSKAQLAGLYTSVLAFALALIYLSASLANLTPTGQIIGLSLVFPPITWANFIGDVALREYSLKAFSLVSAPLIIDEFGVGTRLQKMDGFLYIVFFFIQTIAYSVGTFYVEKILWGIDRKFDKIDGGSNIAIRCRGLNKTYHAKRRWYWPFSKSGKPLVAVNNLDLEVKKGSVTFLLGPNGSGKSTTLKLIAGMAGMDSGSRLELNEDGVVFGICPQQNVLWDTLTVNEHVKIWRRLKTAAFFDDGADNSTTKIDDDDVIGECDLIEKTRAQAKTLSGGQMRKLQLAIAFVGSSSICCIDEATSGLDPLSRRMIWNIVQKGHTRRTVLMTTHFLDEADVLAHHIAIVYQGKLVCEGPSTSLKARFGDNHILRSESESDGNHVVFETTNSAEAARKISELENESNEEKFSVAFPTLEQVFLKVTSSSKAAIDTGGGDGLIGEKQVITEEIAEPLGEEGPVRDIKLDVGRSIGIARQVWTLFHKRHMLLRQKAGWISYGINLVIPVIIACALVKFHYLFKSLQTCQANEEILRNGSNSDYRPGSSFNLNPLHAPTSPYIYVYDGSPTAYLGPDIAFSGDTQDSIYVSSLQSVRITEGYSGVACNNRTCAANQTLSTRQFVNDADSIVRGITNSSGYGYEGFAIFAPTPDSATLFYSTEEYDSAIGVYMAAFGVITNRLANSSAPSGTAKITTASVRTMVHAENNVNGYSLPICALIALTFIVSASISVIYPTFERLNHVRALHYCNGVSPFALWAGYLLFDMQFILVQSIFVWGLLYTGPLSRLYYESSYLLGIFVLFGIATYIGNYVLSLFVKKAAFAVAAGLHVLLCVLYLVAYIMNESFGDKSILHSTYSNIQYGLGLTSPAANLLRGLFVATNSFEILCGKFGNADVSKPFAYVRYGSVYANLLIQILFLIIFLYVYEYGSSGWLHKRVFNRMTPVSSDTKLLNRGSWRQGSEPDTILDVIGVSKQFRNVFAVEDISFSIAANQVLALLGGNGAGKTTTINMIRGVLKPDVGDICVDDVSVLKSPHQARSLMGVCPQDDAVDNLTVFQTLRFYAMVKGLKDVVGNVDRVLNALNISSFADVLVKALSGGTRRKLSVAIALLGNPRVLLLDEPSTGQDAGAKRLLWKALRSVSFGRAILLTTHSMEEAEALATNVAIMGSRMLAIGSLPHLQKEYGGNFTVRAVRTPQITASMAREHIIVEFMGTDMLEYSDIQGQVSFRLSAARTTFGKMMEKMEKLKAGEMSDGHRVIEDYTISGPTLEEVFMNVARTAGQYTGV